MTGKAEMACDPDRIALLAGSAASSFIHRY